MSLISPPPHHDIYSIEDLAQLIYDLRAVNPAARIGVKLVSGAGSRHHRRRSRQSRRRSDHHRRLRRRHRRVAAHLDKEYRPAVGSRPARSTLRAAAARVSAIAFACAWTAASNSARDVVIAALLGADEFGFGTASLLAIGCVMARQCHLNTCPVGIATQDENLRARFTGNPEMVMAYFRGVAERSSRTHGRSWCLARSADRRQRVEQLRPRDECGRTRTSARLLKPIKAVATQLHTHRPAISAPIEIELPESAMDIRRKPSAAWIATSPLRSSISSRSANSDRSVGAHLSGYILRRTNFDGLAGKAIQFEFLRLRRPKLRRVPDPRPALQTLRRRQRLRRQKPKRRHHSNRAGAAASLRGDVLAGNTVLYGATSGELYIAGRAGERFAVRNSGALAVVEGIGHHGCEYMTAGVVIILGPAGMNLGSGMTGGLTYILRDALHEENYNREFVRPAEIGESAEKEEADTREFSLEDQATEAVQGNEDEWLRHILREHFHLTNSPRARRLLESALPLPLVRLQPVHLPCTIAETWSPFLQRREAQESPAANEQLRVSSTLPLEAIGQTGESAC